MAAPDKKARRKARRLLIKSPAYRSLHIYPPKQGHRRPEFSSVIAGRWSVLNGEPQQ